jgi:hypothetical protein
MRLMLRDGFRGHADSTSKQQTLFLIAAPGRFPQKQQPGKRRFLPKAAPRAKRRGRLSES